jgi:uncharacterized protein
LDPWRAAGNGSVFAGRLPLSSFPRLRGILLDEAGDVTFRIAFSRDEERRAVVRCKVDAVLRLRCQRCLEALAHQVATDTFLALVSGMDEERQLPERYDPLLVDDTPIRLGELIEDELLLALPLIPMHDPGDCGTKVLGAHRPQAPTGVAGPFAALAELKREG